jgi:hypothetical protein
MSLLKSLTFTTAAQARGATPEQQRRLRMAAHLGEQLALARADAKGETYVVKKQRWQKDEAGNPQLMEMNKRIKRWWYAAADGSLILVIRWGSRPLEFERGKSAIVIADMAALIKTLDSLATAAVNGELDGMIAAVNRQRAAAKRKAA